MELAVNACLESTREMRSELVATAKDQTNELPSVVRTGHELVTAITNSALTSSADALQKTATRFRETVDHIAEITKLSRHLAPTDNLRVSAKHAEINLKIYAPQVVAAAHTLAQHPSSKIAKENLEGRVAHLYICKAMWKIIEFKSSCLNLSLFSLLMSFKFVEVIVFEKQ